MGLTVSLVRWTHLDGTRTRTHIIHDDQKARATLCGWPVPIKTARVYTAREDLALVREYELCHSCRRAFGVPLTEGGPRRRRRKDAGIGRRAPAWTQLDLLR